MAPSEIDRAVDQSVVSRGAHTDSNFQQLQVINHQGGLAILSDTSERCCWDLELEVATTNVSEDSEGHVICILLQFDIELSRNTYSNHLSLNRCQWERTLKWSRNEF